METRSKKCKRQRLIRISSHVSSWPHVPARFESLNDDTLTTTLQFVGKKSYRSFGGLNYHCKEVYLATEGMTKETFVYGYAPLSVITNRYDNNPSYSTRVALGKGVVLYNRSDVLAWALQRQNNQILFAVCEVAAEEGRIDIMDEVWNNVNDEDDKEYIFGFLDQTAARHGKVEVLRWLETKGLSINNIGCAVQAADKGQLNILQWLQEEEYLKLSGQLYNWAADGGHMNVMKWLREQACPWDKRTFQDAARTGNLNILQWLHIEGCPWPEDRHVPEHRLKPEVIDWCRMNGYGDRFHS